MKSECFNGSSNCSEPSEAKVEACYGHGFYDLNVHRSGAQAGKYDRPPFALCMASSSPSGGRCPRAKNVHTKVCECWFQWQSVFLSVFLNLI